MSRNKINEALSLIDRMHAGEDYPANDIELNAIVDMIWCDIFRRTGYRNTIVCAVQEWIKNRQAQSLSDIPPRGVQSPAEYKNLQKEKQ
jgi:hypothetical protein